MIALVASIVLPALFTASAVLAIGVLAASWRTYGGAYRRLRRELAACDDRQGVAITLIRHEVRMLGTTPRTIPAIRRPALRHAGRTGISPARLPVQPAAA